MKTTENISLAGYAFTVETDAYEELGAYLDEIRNCFSADPSAEEITADIEERIAELLREKCVSGMVVRKGKKLCSGTGCRRKAGTAVGHHRKIPVGQLYPDPFRPVCRRSDRIPLRQKCEARCRRRGRRHEQSLWIRRAVHGRKYPSCLSGHLEP